MTEAAAVVAALLDLDAAVCLQCLQSSAADVGCACQWWRVESMEGCGEGARAASCGLQPHSRLLLDPAALSVPIGLHTTTLLTPQRQQHARADTTGHQPSSPAPSSSAALAAGAAPVAAAPNAAAASLAMLLQLHTLLSGGFAPGASPLARRLGALVRRLAWEPLSLLAQRDPEAATFMAAAAEAFVQAADTASSSGSETTGASHSTAADATSASAHRALRVSLAERLLSAIKLNSFVGSDPASGQQRLVMLLLVSAVNHSCAPNARLVDRELYASRHIAQGEQICISYLTAHEMTLDLQTRRAKLQQGWGFLCRCERCTKEETAAAAGATTKVGPAVEPSAT